MQKTLEQIKAEEFDPFMYNITVNQYSASGKIRVEKGCNTIAVTNLGTNTVIANGVTLFPSPTPATAPGGGIIFGGNKGEIYKGTLELSFLLPVGAAPLVEVIQKFYIAFEL